LRDKIYKAICITTVSIFIVSLVVVMGLSYTYFSSLQREQLRNETELAAQGVSLSGAEYLEGLEEGGYRITWIDAEGNVLYDNQADPEQMENHLEREEVREALESGQGESDRYSNTLAQKEMYSAKRLEDGSVLRLSIVQAAVWMLILRFAQPICILILLALSLSFMLASRLAQRIVKPINEIDLDHPENYYGQENYREVEPLLRHIYAQRVQLMKDQKEIEKTSLIRQEFTANVSHELKTPLHVISGYAELLENGMVQEKDIPGFAQKIRTESLRLTKLVEDIIDLTKLDNGGAEMPWEECDLYLIAENAADSIEAEAGAMGVTVTIEGQSAPLRAVPQQLYSVVYNLLDNAVKYNHRGGSVVLSVTQDADVTVLKVSDTGCGIPEESLERIFERFYRVDKSRSKEAGGTGLGLSIVKHIVMLHQGTVDVKSRMGEGTEFIVTLPKAPKDTEV